VLRREHFRLFLASLIFAARASTLKTASLRRLAKLALWQNWRSGKTGALVKLALWHCMPGKTGYLLRRPFKKIKLVGNERKGLRTNFPRWREPQAKLYLYIILPEQYYY
jgi:hypothetical protein